MSMRIDPQATLRFALIRRTDDAKDQARKAGRNSGPTAPAEPGLETARTSPAGLSPGAPSAPASGQDPVRPAVGPDDLQTALRNVEAQSSDLQAIARRLQETQHELGWVPADTNRERPGAADPDEARQTAETLRRQIEAQAQVAARVQVRGLAGTAVNLLA